MSGVPPSIRAHLAAERAEVLAVLADLNLLNLLAQAGTIPRAVLAHDAHLLGALRLHHRTDCVSINSCMSPGDAQQAGDHPQPP